MSLQHSVAGSSLADILERILDKGIVVAGDISISLVGVELLTIRIRLVVASVDRALEMGIRWWRTTRRWPAPRCRPRTRGCAPKRRGWPSGCRASKARSRSAGKG